MLSCHHRPPQQGQPQVATQQVATQQVATRSPSAVSGGGQILPPQRLDTVGAMAKPGSGQKRPRNWLSELFD